MEGDLVDLGDFARYPSDDFSSGLGVKSKLGNSLSCDTIRASLHDVHDWPNYIYCL